MPRKTVRRPKIKYQDVTLKSGLRGNRSQSSWWQFGPVVTNGQIEQDVGASNDLKTEFTVPTIAETE